MYEASASQIVMITGAIITFLVVVSLLKKEKSEGLKQFLFWGMVLPITAATLFLILQTVHENRSSATGGPVHWHADFEIYYCGQEVDLLNPKGLVNRIGSAVLHEHGDNRIHVEGTVRQMSDINLASFFDIIGGSMTQDHLVLPTNSGELTMQNGSSCPGDGKGRLQVFVYKTRDGVVTQTKLADFSSYVLSGYSQIPPGDCLIIEFDPKEKAKTDKICNFYEIALEKGDLKYED